MGETEQSERLKAEIIELLHTGGLYKLIYETLDYYQVEQGAPHKAITKELRGALLHCLDDAVTGWLLRQRDLTRKIHIG